MSIKEASVNLFLHALQQGDERAYATLVDTYHHQLCAYAITLIHDRDASEDIVQNVFINIWKKRENIQSIKNFKSYLFQSVHNEFIDYLRREKTLFTYEQKYAEGLKRITEDESFDIEKLTQIVATEIDKLPKKCKEVFLLSRKEGLTNKEIAEYLGVSIKTVEAHIAKAFNDLKDKLGNNMNAFLFLAFGASWFKREE